MRLSPAQVAQLLSPSEFARVGWLIDQYSLMDGAPVEPGKYVRFDVVSVERTEDLVTVIVDLGPNLIRRVRLKKSPRAQKQFKGDVVAA